MMPKDKAKARLLFVQTAKAGEKGAMCIATHMPEHLQEFEEENETTSAMEAKTNIPDFPASADNLVPNPFA